MRENLDALKEKAKVDYENKLKELEIEYQKNLDAIERVFALMDVKTPPTISIDTEEPKPQAKQEDMASSQIVREIIGAFASTFSVRDIRMWASNMTPPLQVSKNVLHNVIKQKMKKGEIEMVERGSGRSPNVYRKTGVKKKGSDSHMDEPEPNVDTGDVPERLKGADL